MNRQQRYALMVLMLAGFVTIFDLFVVNVALVSIENSFNSSFTALTLIIVIYELGFGLLLITGGRLGDIHGPKSLYRIGMLCFMLASLGCAIALSSNALILARLLQGLAAALLFPQVYASIRYNFNPQQAKTAFAFLGMSLGLAAIAGQVVGGLLIELDLFGLSWRSIFLINLPIGGLALYWSKYLNSQKSAEKISLDGFGVVLSSIGISLSLIPILMMPIWGWTWLNSAVLILGLLFISGFIKYEIRHQQQGKTPLLAVGLFKNKSFVLGILIVLCIYATSSAFPFMMTMLFQRGLELSAFQSGLLFMPASIGFVAASFLTPRWQQRFGNRVLLLGAICYAMSYLILMLLVGQWAMVQPIWIFIPLMFLVGFSQGMLMTPMLNLVLATVDLKLIGMASGLTATLQQVGAALGAAVVGSIFQLSLKHFAELETLIKLEKAFALSLGFNVVVVVIACYLFTRILKAQYLLNP